MRRSKTKNKSSSEKGWHIVVILQELLTQCLQLEVIIWFISWVVFKHQYKQASVLKDVLSFYKNLTPAVTEVTFFLKSQSKVTAPVSLVLIASAARFNSQADTCKSIGQLTRPWGQNLTNSQWPWLSQAISRSLSPHTPLFWTISITWSVTRDVSLANLFRWHLNRCSEPYAPWPTPLFLNPVIHE